MVRLIPSLLRLARAYASAGAALGLALWVRSNFGEPSIDQILYHLQFSEGAAVQMSGIFIFTFVMEVLVIPLVFALLGAAVHVLVVRSVPRIRRKARALPSLSMAAGVAALLAQFSAFSYAASYLEPDHFGAGYVAPQQVRLAPERPRNLVIIYAESLDAAYGDASLFGRDLLAPLRRAGGDSFPSYRQEPGTNWTIAGMVATQCGVPLKGYTEHDVPRTDGERTFLPSAVCLGDLLQERGYRNVFMGGAPLSFAGKGSFLRDHGYTEVHGREEWERAGATPDEFNVWGLYDSSLLQRAKTKLADLHAAGEPFNLTLLTLDTHNPHGFMSPACRNRGARDFEGIVLCASEQLDDFVRFAQDQGYLENTTIVIFGDHLAVPNPVFDKLKQAPQRGIFNVMIGTDLPQRNTDSVVHFDFFPTLVELAGLRVEGDRLGLGYSAIGTPQAARPEQRPSVSLLGLNGSPRYRALWSAGPSAAAPLSRTLRTSAVVE